MPSLQELLDDLNTLLSHEKIDRNNFNKIIDTLNTDTFRNYLQIICNTKPETAFEQVLSDFFNALGISRIVPQAKIRKDWIDYEITSSSSSNPVGLEVKPLHRCHRGIIRINELETEMKKQENQFARSHSNQITAYLTRYDYVIFTNGKDVYYFSREARFDFAPFHREPFADFVEELSKVKDVWELARRKEDAIPKVDLDEKFFQDLKYWYNILNDVRWKGDSAKVEEAKILLLNKFIFIQTLEDHALIPFKFLQNIYEEKKRMWSPRGTKKFLQEFLNEINKWFYTYYDTEIFRLNVLDYVEDDEENYEKLAESIEIILGFGRWNPTFGKGLTFYNFRQIDEDVFGKSYEMFLAENRKAEGIYYTPKEITTYMASRLVDSLFRSRIDDLIESIDERDYEEAEKIARQITEIAIIDPASGSGSFLVKVLREIFKYYLRLEEETRWADSVSVDQVGEPEHMKYSRRRVREIRRILGFEGVNIDRKKLISRIILRHIFGVDLDERAVEIAKVNLWKEAIKLSPRDFRYDRLNQEGHILPDLRMNIVAGDSVITPPDEEVLQEISGFREDIRNLWELRNRYIEDPLNPEILMDREKHMVQPRIAIMNRYREPLFEKSVFFPLQFFFLYFDRDGNPLPEEERGFHGVIGNPPWENIKPAKKEFAALHSEIFGNITKFSIEGTKF